MRGLLAIPALLLLSSAAGQSQPTFTISTAAGNGVAGYSGDGGPATAAELNDPNGVAVDTVGNLYIAEFMNHRVRKVAADGSMTTVAGTGVAGFSGDGGPASSARLNEPFRVALDKAGNLYISDYGNFRVRKVALDGTITTVAGNGNESSDGDGGPAASASIDSPGDLVLDSAGNLFVTSGAFVGDGTANVIREVTPDGLIATVAGNGTAGYSGDGGPATSAALHAPEGLAIDSAGNLYIADQINQRIRKVSGGIITTVAGNGLAGYAVDGGPAGSAELSGPAGFIRYRRQPVYRRPRQQSCSCTAEQWNDFDSRERWRRSLHRRRNRRGRRCPQFPAKPGGVAGVHLRRGRGEPESPPIDPRTSWPSLHRTQRNCSCLQLLKYYPARLPDIHMWEQSGWRRRKLERRLCQYAGRNQHHDK